MVDKGIEKFKACGNVDLKVGSMADFPYPDNSFDSMMCNQVVQHVETAESMPTRGNLAKSLADSFRVLKPGGIINISTRSKEPQYKDLYW